MAALVNSNTTDFVDKTIRLGADISLLRYEEPGKPGEPSQPTQPEKPTTPDTPATGDSSNVTALWVVLAVAGVGIIVLVGLLVTKRKNKKD
ncbi:LPXTG cell wall anchor domain-containing protein [Vescimonas sp.]